MQGRTLSKICVPVIHFFNKAIDDASQSVKFVKRKSKLDAKNFVETLICSCISGDSVSLERMCALLKSRGIKMTKQGLHQRFNADAQQLMKKLFARALDQFKTEKDKTIKLFSSFTSVKITDSSTVSLPENLQEIYRGLGGVSSKSSMKLQLTYDYLSQQIKKMDITGGCASDQSYKQHLDHIEAGALYLQDLGYFSAALFRKIHVNKAYFVSRHLYRTALFDRDGKEIDLLATLKKSPDFLEKEVYLHKSEKLPVRIIAFRLSESEMEKRMRKIRRSFSRKGKRPSKEVLKFAPWSIYITNVSDKVLTAKQVHLVYTVRWQIELLFKLCKSEIGIDKVNGRNENRVLCEIYAKLICVIQFLYICFPFNCENNDELSLQKSYKLFKLRGLGFFNALTSKYRFINFMKKLTDDITEFCLKDRYRKKRRSTYQKLIGCSHALEGVVM